MLVEAECRPRAGRPTPHSFPLENHPSASIAGAEESVWFVLVRRVVSSPTRAESVPKSLVMAVMHGRLKKVDGREPPLQQRRCDGHARNTF